MRKKNEFAISHKDDNVKIKKNVKKRMKYFAVLRINEMHV